jgi:hypothetical protein
MPKTDKQSLRNREQTVAIPQALQMLDPTEITRLRDPCHQPMVHRVSCTRVV